MGCKVAVSSEGAGEGLSRLTLALSCTRTRLVPLRSDSSPCNPHPTATPSPAPSPETATPCSDPASASYASMLSLPLAGIGAVAGIFGMNLRSGFEEAAHMFALVRARAASATLAGARGARLARPPTRRPRALSPARAAPAAAGPLPQVTGITVVIAMAAFSVCWVRYHEHNLSQGRQVLDAQAMKRALDLVDTVHHLARRCADGTQPRMRKRLCLCLRGRRCPAHCTRSAQPAPVAARAVARVCAALEAAAAPPIPPLSARRWPLDPPSPSPRVRRQGAYAPGAADGSGSPGNGSLRRVRGLKQLLAQNGITVSPSRAPSCRSASRPSGPPPVPPLTRSLALSARDAARPPLARVRWRASVTSSSCRPCLTIAQTAAATWPSRDRCGAARAPLPSPKWILAYFDENWGASGQGGIYTPATDPEAATAWSTRVCPRSRSHTCTSPSQSGRAASQRQR